MSRALPLVGTLTILVNLSGCVPPVATPLPPAVRDGLVYHPESDKPVDCTVLLAWRPEDARSGIKGMDFNREVGGLRGVMVGLSPSQLQMGLRMREACRSVAQPEGSTDEMSK